MLKRIQIIQYKLTKSCKEKIQLNKIETCKIINIAPNFLQVITETELNGTIHISQVSIDYVTKLEQKFRIEQSVLAVIIGLGDSKGIQLSIKKHELLQRISERERLI